MPEQFLNTAQVRARIEQMRGITVPELVRREIRIQTGQRQIFFQTKLQLPRRDRLQLSWSGQKHGDLSTGRVGKQIPVLSNDTQCCLANRDQPLLSSLAAHADLALIPINVRGQESAKLTDAQTARVDGFQ